MRDGLERQGKCLVDIALLLNFPAQVANSDQPRNLATVRLTGSLKWIEGKNANERNDIPMGRPYRRATRRFFFVQLGSPGGQDGMVSSGAESGTNGIILGGGMRLQKNSFCYDHRPMRQEQTSPLSPAFHSSFGLLRWSIMYPV